MALSKGQRNGSVAATINAQLVGRTPRAIAVSLLHPPDNGCPTTEEPVVRSRPGVYRDGWFAGELHNSRLKPPAHRVTRLARQAARRSVRGLAARYADSKGTIRERSEC